MRTLFPIPSAPTSASVPRSVRQALALLSTREEIVVRLSYGLGGEARDLASVAAALGLSPEATRRLRRRALEKLRSHAGARVD